MSAPDTVPADRLAELLVSAAAHLVTPGSPRAALTPAGIPIGRGRVHLGRLRSLLDGADALAVVTGFGTAAWLGPRTVAAPNLGRLVYRATTRLDGRGRVVLDARVRNWLAVADPLAFEAVIVPAPSGGVLVVPVDEFARRWEVITR
jgi:hypothetical protein